jgi:hypothetical protein
MLCNKAKMKIFIPKFFDEFNAFSRETTGIECMGVLPVKFYDTNDNELMSTMLTIPTLLDFNLYSDIQEDMTNYVVSYEPGSPIVSLGITKSAVAVELFINQIYLYSKVPQIPYHLITEMMFLCLDINGIDLTGPSIIYELLAKRVCRHGNDTFGKLYGSNPNVDPMSYTKLAFREAVQRESTLSGIMFQALSESTNIGLAQTLNGIESKYTPLEDIIKA